MQVYLNSVLFLAGLAASAAPTPAQTLRHVSAYNAHPGDNDDDTQEIGIAIATAPDNTTIVFASGVYDLFKIYSPHNPAGGIPILGRTGITLQGNGATLLLHNFDPTDVAGHADVLLAQDVVGLTIQDFTIEMVRPPTTQGTITAITIAPPAWPTISVRIGHPRYFLDPNSPAPPNLQNVQAHYEDTHPRARAVDHDTVGHFLPPTTPAPYTVTFVAMTAMDQDIDIALDPQWHGISVLQSMRVGEWLSMGHFSNGWSGNFLRAERCRNIVLDRMTVNTIPGRFVVSGYCENITARDCWISPPANSDQLVNNNADQFHCQRTKGTIAISDCTFARSQDDGCSFSMQWGNVLAVNGNVIDVNSALTVGFKDPARLIGENIAFYGTDLVSARGSAPVQAASFVDLDGDGVNEYRLTLPSGSVPNVVVGDVCYESDWQPTSVSIQRCHFEKNRKSGILTSLPNTSVRECTFHQLPAPAIYATANYMTDPYWANTAAFPSLLWIEGCAFNDCAYATTSRGYNKGAAVEISGYNGVSNAFTAAGTLQGIAVRINSFTNLDGGGLLLASTRYLLVEGNWFQNVNIVRRGEGIRSHCLWIENCDAGTVIGNWAVPGSYFNLKSYVNVSGITSDW